MCLAVPAKVLEINGSMGKVELSGVTEKDIEETNALLAEMNGAPRTLEDIPEMASRQGAPAEAGA